LWNGGAVARPSPSARFGQLTLLANQELRYREVELRPRSRYPGQKALRLGVVHVQEPSPPATPNRSRGSWSPPARYPTPEQAQQCQQWYCLRWSIEDWHRVLKSVCRIEALQHMTAERLKRVIAISLVIAWRIMLMTLLGRQYPDLPAEMLFSDAEIEVLQAYAKKRVYVVLCGSGKKEAKGEAGKWVSFPAMRQAMAMKFSTRR